MYTVIPFPLETKEDEDFLLFGFRNNHGYFAKSVIQKTNEKVDLHPGRLVINNFRVILPEDFFSCETLEIHVKKFTDVFFVFPECTYSCKKIEIHVKEADISGKNRYINIDNNNCPVEISVRIYKEKVSDADGDYYILPSKRGKVTVQSSIKGSRVFLFNQ